MQCHRRFSIPLFFYPSGPPPSYASRSHLFSPPPRSRQSFHPSELSSTGPATEYLPFCSIRRLQRREVRCVCASSTVQSRRAARLIGPAIDRTPRRNLHSKRPPIREQESEAHAVRNEICSTLSHLTHRLSLAFFPLQRSCDIDRHDFAGGNGPRRRPRRPRQRRLHCPDSVQWHWRRRRQSS